MVDSREIFFHKSTSTSSSLQPLPFSKPPYGVVSPFHSITHPISPRRPGANIDFSSSNGDPALQRVYVCTIDLIFILWNYDFQNLTTLRFLCQSFPTSDKHDNNDHT